ncbi:MAG TPA: hypothetical protein PK733_05695 [Clostridiales bacterium]|nr:hypothetical protein [Clostridiales bacterium]
MKNAYIEFPRDWRIINSYIFAMIDDRDHLNKNISEIRRLCRKTLNECTDQLFRDNAISNMIRICYDSEVEEWYSKVSIDLKGFLKAERYRYREQWDLYNKQNDLNQYVKLIVFLLNLRPVNCSASESLDLCRVNGLEKCQKANVQNLNFLKHISIFEKCSCYSSQNQCDFIISDKPQYESEEIFTRGYRYGA